MYLPSHTEETDIGTLHAMLRAHPLGTWVMHDASGLTANHIPFLLIDDGTAYGTLVAHVARANPVWQQIATSSESLVIFQGPQSYISPSWYPSKQVHGKAVPTWNYAVLHARGIARAIDDVDWLLQHVTQLSTEHEARRSAPWKVSDAPADYIDKMRRAIVGIEIPLTTLQGKWKLGLNRPVSDQQGIVEGLQASDTAAARAMAELLLGAMALRK